MRRAQHFSFFMAKLASLSAVAEQAFLLGYAVTT